MCTVTYIPTPGGFVLTSSRDERQARPTLAPQEYSHGIKQLTYPKDEMAGGTWIATDRQGSIACLLNGAFENHEKQPNYLKSRGLVLLESFTVLDASDFWHGAELKGVEPFTLLLLRSQANLTFLECRWDGKQKHMRAVDTARTAIWSSATLYDHTARMQREHWFAQWIQRHAAQEDHNIIGFHTSRHGDNLAHDVLMERDGGLRTISVTQMVRCGRFERMIYQDLVSDHHAEFLFTDDILAPCIADSLSP